MAAMTSARVHVALTPKQLKVLDKLCEKLLIDRSNVVRIALARLAETEGVK